MSKHVKNPFCHSFSPVRTHPRALLHFFLQIFVSLLKVFKKKNSQGYKLVKIISTTPPRTNCHSLLTIKKIQACKS